MRVGFVQAISTACYLAASESRVRVRVRVRSKSKDKALAAMMRCVSQPRRRDNERSSNLLEISWTETRTGTQYSLIEGSFRESRSRPDCDKEQRSSHPVLQLVTSAWGKSRL
jgi:hypothetical protein